MNSKDFYPKTFFDPVFIQNGNLDKLSNLSRKKYFQKKSILNFLYTKGQLSNPEICKLTNMSSPSIQKLLNELIGDDLVRDEGIGHSIGGRRPNMYGLNPDSRYIIGISIGHNSSEIAVFNIINDVIDQVQVIDIALQNSPEFVESLYQSCIEIFGQLRLDINKLLGVGIGIPGLTDPVSGKSYSYLDYSDKTVKELFEEKFGKPVFVDNDARVMALGEYVFGHARDRNNVLCLNIGSGIGMGMILNGKIYHGNSGFAGEFGHIKVEEEGTLCICGKRGCLETVASGDALVKRAVLEIKAGKSTKILPMVDGNTDRINSSTIVDAAKDGDQLAIDLLATIGEYLGRGLATLIHIFNPESIVLGGKLARAEQFIIDPIQQTLNKYTIYKIKNDTVITTTMLGGKSAVMGAMALVMHNIFEDVKHNVPV